MKRLSLLLLVAFFGSHIAMASDSKNESTVYIIQTGDSKIEWTGKKVTGQHNGNLQISEGEIVAVGNDIVRANLKMDMNSITCSDLTDPEWNKKLVNHLKSDDFFSAEEHPVATFKTTRFVKNHESATGEQTYIVTGDLTIKGITNTVSFPVNTEAENGLLTATGTAILDRTKWDIKYNSGSIFKGLGDKMIYDEFEIKFDLVAKAETVN